MRGCYLSGCYLRGCYEGLTAPGPGPRPPCPALPPALHPPVSHCEHHQLQAASQGCLAGKDRMEGGGEEDVEDNISTALQIIR